MAREQALRIEKQREQNAKDELLDRMSADMAKRQKERDEMENLRNGMCSIFLIRTQLHSSVRVLFSPFAPSFPLVTPTRRTSLLRLVAPPLRRACDTGDRGTYLAERKGEDGACRAAANGYCAGQ